ncbi:MULTISPECIES: DUF6441 family protein [Sphingomonadales]|uniref:DUF6441 family protein n=1 Tax=Alteraurantiacibacter lauratis TaxID=2054627 RepID=A0ABV7EFE3_9SPHN|nr:DUF6441 family protein [Sphingopyxis sp. LK2115]
MRLELTTIGDLRQIMAEEVAAAEQAVSGAVAEATGGLKDELRAQVTGAGLGTRLARTWRGQVWPKGEASLGAAGLVWSKAPLIIRGHAEGALIRARHATFLAIPTEAARAMRAGGRRLTPRLWEQRMGQPLRFVPGRAGRPALLVGENLRARSGRRGGYARASTTAMRTGHGLVSVVLFVLVPQVRLSKRLDVGGAAERWIARLEDRIVRRWN